MIVATIICSKAVVSALAVNEETSRIVLLKCIVKRLQLAPDKKDLFTSYKHMVSEVFL